MSWLLAILGFSALVVLHEAGHFVAAKVTGMRVERFFLFFPPKLVSIKMGETEYGIGALPLGGFVKIAGMSRFDQEDSDSRQGEGPAESREDDPRGYYKQPVWKRLVVIGAGPGVNIVLAFVLLFVVAFHVPNPTNRIQSVLPRSPAAAAGLGRGDRIVAVDGHAFGGDEAMKRIEGFSKLISGHRCPAAHPFEGCRASTPALLTVERNARRRTLAVYPTYDSALRRSRLGLEWGFGPPDSSVPQATSFAWTQMTSVASQTFGAVAHIFESKERKQLSGIVGISAVTHEAINAGATQALFLLGLISLLLGLFNLLPFLPLDGGHIFWALVEKLRGRPTSLLVMERVSAIGFVLIAMLMVIGLSNDIGRLTGEGFHVR